MAIGIHLSLNYLDKIQDIPFDGNVQIMTGSPQSVNRQALESLIPFSRYQSIDKQNSIIHGSLCLNPCRGDFNGYSQRYLEREIEIANLLNIKKIVIHPGYLNKTTREEAIQNIAFLLRQIQPLLVQTKTKILLENMPGKFNMFMNKLEDYKSVLDNLDKITKQYIGYCLDTCHYNDANNGYTLRRFLNDMNENNLSYPDYVHLNNSSWLPPHLAHGHSGPKDRHKTILKGTINPSELRTSYTHFEAHNIPMVLETYTELKDFTTDILYLKEGVRDDIS